jgi:hypothetical protein
MTFRPHLNTPAQRVQVLLAITSVGLLFGLYTSAPLWGAARSYPLVPLWSSLTAEESLQQVLFVSALIGLLVSVLGKWGYVRYFLNFCVLILISFRSAWTSHSIGKIILLNHISHPANPRHVLKLVPPQGQYVPKKVVF